MEMGRRAIMGGRAVISVQLELKISEIDFSLGFRFRVHTSPSFLCTMHSLQSKCMCELFSLWEVLCATEHFSRAHDHYTKSDLELLVKVNHNEIIQVDFTIIFQLTATCYISSRYL